MGYYFAETIEASFDEAISRTRDELTAEGFGILTEIDVQKTLKSKIDVDFKLYLILGASNLGMAHQAHLVEDKAGAMLPCNVVVQERPEGTIEVAAVDPVASMAHLQPRTDGEDRGGAEAPIR